jgi:hypothetical protein
MFVYVFDLGFWFSIVVLVVSFVIYGHIFVKIVKTKIGVQ